MVMMRSAAALLLGLLGLAQAADVTVAAGEQHAVLLDAHGRIWSWGANGSGQLGNNTTTPTEVPVLGQFQGSGTLTEFIAVAAGGEISSGFTVALRANGSVWSWGDNARGQLGNGVSGTFESGAVQLFQYSGSTFTTARMIAVSAGRAHVVALRGDGTVWTWGDDTYGQCGQGTSATLYNGAKQVAGLSGVIAVAAGGYHSLALKADGTVWSWGLNGVGELGDDTATMRTTPVQVKTGASTFLTGVMAISAGYEASMALTATGEVYCWGADDYGQIGDNATYANKDLATETSGVSGVRAIACGQWGHKFALTYTGAVYGWGYNGDGRMGYSTFGDQTTPVQIYASGVRSVSAGRTRSLFILGSGEVQQAGLSLSAPAQVAPQWPLSAIQRVASGGNHTLALKADGTVWAWGLNSSGQLGIGTSSGNQTTPVQVLTGVGTPLTGIVAVEAGNQHSMALSVNGTVYCWGANTYGQTGNGTLGGTQTYAYPAYPYARSIAAGAHSCYAVYYSGYLASWGYNGVYTLGDGTTTDTGNPHHYVFISSGTYLYPVRSVGAGSYHALAIKPDGTGVGWGYNPYSGLGTGTAGSITYATGVPSGLSGFKAVTGGFHHSLWTTGDGKLYAAGRNTSAQFGNGGTTSSTTPVQVATGIFSGSSGLGVRQMSSGNLGGHAVRADGFGFGWGANSLREAGVASSTDPILSPTQLAIAESPLSYEGRVWQLSTARNGSHGALVTKDGDVHCWGSNGSGQFGNGTTDSSTISSGSVTTSPLWYPTVTVAASDPTATESGQTTGALTVSRTLSTAGMLSVNLSSWTGGASAADVSVTPPLTVVIPGSSASATVTVTPVDDSLDEDDEATTINLASGNGYQLGGATNASVTIADNDTAGFTVSAISGNTTEAGGTATFTVRLNSQPTANVTIPLSSSNTAEGTIAIANLVFTAANWSSTQMVTVTGVNDNFDDSNVGYTITTSNATSSDPRYNGLNPADVAVTNVDNDTAGISMVALHNRVIEVEKVLTSTGVSSDKVFLPGGTDLSLVSAGMRLRITGVGPNSGAVLAIDDVDDANDVIYLQSAITDTGIAETVTIGSSARIGVTLNSQPSASVTIGFSSGDGTEGSVSPISVTIPADQWNTIFYVDLSPVNDDQDDGDVAYSVVTAAATSSDPLYTGMNAADVAVSTVDDDTAALIVAETGPGTAVAESGGSDTYTIRLATQPTSSVTVGVSPNIQVQATPASLVFTTANWSTPQTVTVSAVDDAVAEDAHTGTVTHNVTAGDAVYVALTTEPSLVAAITDNDTAGFIITPTSGLTVAEASGTTTFTVRLSSQPTAGVTLPLSVSDASEASLSAASLSFSTANWSTAQTVTITGVVDQVDDGDEPFTVVTGNPSSSDPRYSGATANPTNVSATNLDDDTAALVLTQTGGTTAVTEGGATDTYNVRLASAPTGNVTITLSGTQVTTAPVSLTFTTADWSTDQPVTVTAVNDSLSEGTHAGSVSHTAVGAGSDDGYAGGSVSAAQSVSITDNDSASISVSAISGNTSEGGATATFTVVLTSQPTASVTIPVSSSNTAEGTVDDTDTGTGGIQGLLCFGAAASGDGSGRNVSNLRLWSSAISVTVRGVDDSPPVDDGNIAFTVVTGAATSADPAYSGANPADVTVVNDDNDTAAVNIAVSDNTLVEGGGTGSYTVVLTTRPTSNVVVTVGPNGQQSVSSATLTFTSANWNSAQAVTVTAVDDPDIEGAHAGLIEHSAASSDASYNGLTGVGASVGISDVTPAITDNDTAAIELSVASLQTTEDGGNQTFTVQLAARPTANVTVTLTLYDPGTVTPNPDYATVLLSTASLTFTNANWNVAQNVTVTGQDDGIDDDVDTDEFGISFVTTSTDGNFSGIPASLQGVNIDNDGPGVSVLPLTGLTCGESAGVATFSVRLNATTSGTVTVSLVSADLGEGTVSPATMEFTAANFNTPQVATVTGVNDSVDDGDTAFAITTSISASSDLVNYPLAMPIADPTVVCLDDDTAGLIVAVTSGATLVNESGSTSDTITVRLATEPTADVTVSITGDVQATASPASRTFTSATWATPQSFTVTAIDDDLDEDPAHVGSVTLAASGGGYSAVAAVTSDVVVLDNDTAAFVVGAITGSGVVNESGAAQTFTVRLASEPAALVGVALSSSNTSAGTVLPGTLTFTPADWNADQVVTVTGVDDQVADGSQAFSVILAAATSADPDYAGINPADVAATCTDNDTAAVIVAETGGATSVIEGLAATDSYTIVLATMPIGTVVVTPTPAAGVTVSPPTLTFTAANWNVPQEVAVTAFDDDVAETTPHVQVISHAADGEYAAVVVANVAVQVADNDAAAVVIAASDGSTDVDESGGSDSYTVVLATQPTATVTVSVSPDGEVTATPASLTFTTGNWNVVQTVTVGAIDDDEDEAGSHDGTVTHAAAGGGYDAIAIADVTVHVLDDDSAGVVVTPTSGLTLTEAGNGAFFAVSLASKPAGPVTVTCSSQTLDEADLVGTDADGGSAGTQVQLTFTAADWSQSQLVQVVGVDDDVADGGQPVAISTVTASAGDPAYDGINTPDVSCITVDDDAVGVTVSTAAVTVGEAGAGANYTIRLTSAPSAAVAVTASPNGQLAVTPQTVWFSATGSGAGTSAGDARAWNSPATIAVSAVDDDIDEGDDGTVTHTGTIAHGASGGDYGAVTIVTVTATISDNDTAGFVVTPAPAGASRAVLEGADGLSSGQLALTLTSATGVAQLSAGTDLSLYFPGQAVYLAAQEIWAVVVTIDDGNDRMTLSNVPVDATNETLLFLSGFRVRLASRPTSLVILSFSSADTSEGDMFPSSLTFTPETWDVDRVVSVSGADDDLDDGDVVFQIVSGTSFSADAFYNGLSADPVDITNVDDESAGVTVTPVSGLSVREGGTSDVFTVVLDSQPTATVSIPVSVSAATQVQTDVATLIFTSANWNQAQTVTVTGLDLDDAENPPAGVVVGIVLGAPVISAGSDAQYDALADADVDDVAVTVLPSNAPPALAALPSVNLNEDDALSPYTVTVTGLGTGQTGEAQTLTVSASIDNGSLAVLSVPTAVSAGVSTFTIALVQHASGSGTVTVTVVDDASIDGVVQTTSASFLLTILPVNDAPLVDLDGDATSGDGHAAGTFTEGDAAMSVVESGSLLLSDVDNVTAVSATAALQAAPDGSAELLDATITGFPFISKSFNPATGTLTLVGASPQPLSDFQTILRTLTYRNTSDNPTLGARAIDVRLNDGTVDGPSDTAGLTIAGSNDDPLLDLDGVAAGTGFSGAWTEGGGPVPAVESTTLTISDPDGATITGAVATIAAIPDGAAETLSATVGATGIVATWSSPTLTLAGSASLTAYQQVLRTVVYDNADQDPTAAPRTVTLTVDDNGGGSASAVATLSITTVNDAPDLDLNGVAAGTDSTATYVEDTVAVAIVDAGLTLGDPDSANLANGATVRIINLIDVGSEELAAPGAPGGITASYTAATGILTLTGVAPVTDYETALRSLTYRNQSQNPATTTRDVLVTVNDGAGGIDTASATVTVVAANDAPVLDLNGPSAGNDMDTPASYLEGAPAQIVPIAGALVTDPDSLLITDAILTLQNHPDGDGTVEVLAVNAAAATSYGVTVSWDTTACVLTLSGSAGLAEYQQLIGSLTYQNLSDTPTGGAPDDRLIRIEIDDGIDASTASFASVRISAQNDDPEIVVSGDTTLPLGGILAIADAETVADPELILAASDADNALSALTFTVSLRPNLGSLFNGASVINNGDSFTVADLAAGSIRYEHGGLLAGADGFAVEVDDGAGGSAVAIITLLVTGLVPPQLTVDDAVPATWTEGDSPVQLDAGALIVDTDSANFGGGSITVANTGGLPGDRIDFDPALVGNALVRDGADLRLGSGGAVVGTFSGGTDDDALVIGLTAFCTPAIAQTIVRGLTWTNSGDDPAADPDTPENRVLSVVVNDGSLASPAQVRTIVVDPVDDVPVLVPYTVSLVPGLTVPGQLAAVDPEGETVAITLGTPLAANGLVVLAGDGSFTYQHQILDGLSDTFGVVLTEAGGGGQTATATVQVLVSVPDATAPRISSAAPVRAESGVLFTYTPVVAGFGTDREYVLLPAVQEAVSGAAVNPADYTFSGGLSGGGATGTLRITSPSAPVDGGGYLRSGILVIDRTSGRAAYQPLLIKIAPGFSG